MQKRRENRQHGPSHVASSLYFLSSSYVVRFGHNCLITQPADARPLHIEGFYCFTYFAGIENLRWIACGHVGRGIDQEGKTVSLTYGWHMYFVPFQPYHTGKLFSVHLWVLGLFPLSSHVGTSISCEGLQNQATQSSRKGSFCMTKSFTTSLCAAALCDKQRKFQVPRFQGLSVRQPVKMKATSYKRRPLWNEGGISKGFRSDLVSASRQGFLMYKKPAKIRLNSGVLPRGASTTSVSN